MARNLCMLFWLVMERSGKNKGGKKGSSGRGKSMNSEDTSLWAHVTRRVTPMESNRHTGFEDLLRDAIPLKSVLKSSTSAPRKRSGKLLVPRPALKTSVQIQNQVFKEAVEPSARQNVAGLDRNSSERLRRGKMIIEGRVDLHGLTRKEAFAKLRIFIHSAHRAGKRCVLVITGKGSSIERTDDASFMGGGRKGVLREEVPKWLTEAALHPMVLDYRTAQPKHGGGGALYVLLRRARP
ncbi:MAG: Smr/MutS family protein [Sneathiella sp.]